MPETKSFGTFRLTEIAESFPQASESLLLDVYLTDQPSASTRLFRVYRSTPPSAAVINRRRTATLQPRRSS